MYYGKVVYICVYKLVAHYVKNIDMKHLIPFLLIILMVSCQSGKTTDNGQTETIELKVESNGQTDIEEHLDSSETFISEIKYDESNECECIDYMFSEKGDSPLIKHKIGNRELIVCGYRNKSSEDFHLGYWQPDSSMYVSGYNIFDCSETPIKSIYNQGEFYLERIKLKPHSIIIEQLIRIPTDTTFSYNYTPVIATEFYEYEGSLTKRTDLIFQTENISNEFLEIFKEKINLAKKDTPQSYKYFDYLIHYQFIMAVMHPEKYGTELRRIGEENHGFDGYVAVLYRDLLVYYELIEK